MVMRIINCLKNKSFLKLTLLLLSLVWMGGAKAREAPVFKRGFNLIDVLSFAKRDPVHPSGYRWPPFETKSNIPSRELLRSLKSSGFDFVRLPVEVGPYLTVDAEKRAELDKILLDLIALFHAERFAVIVDLHPAIGIPKHSPKDFLAGLDSQAFTQYRQLVREMTSLVRKVRSGMIALELMNEPQRVCVETEKTDWQEYQKILYRDAREIAPELPLFLTGGCWSAIEGIIKLDMNPYRDDEKAYLSVHFYDPYLYTHQGAHWGMALVRGIKGLPYPASEGDVESVLQKTQGGFSQVRGLDMPVKEQAARDADDKIRGYFRQRQGRVMINLPLKKLDNWVKDQGIEPYRVVFTEFGVFKQMEEGGEVDKDSRLRWLKDVTELLKEREWGWAIWVLNRGRFGIFDGDERHPDPDTLWALGLRAKTHQAD
jgi:endoglucanase